MIYNTAYHDILVRMYSGGEIPAELASLLWTTRLENARNLVLCGTSYNFAN
jgi:hypothetical protein